MIMAKNRLTLAVFAFDTINGMDYLSIMTSQRVTDGKYELPSIVFEELSDNPEDIVRSCLSDRVTLPERINVFSIGTFSGQRDGEKNIITAYGVFLDERPNDAFGINWMVIAPDGVWRKPLDERDELILSEAKKALTRQTLFCDQIEFAAESRKKLMQLFISKDTLREIATQLEGYTKVDVTGLESVSDEDLRKALESRKDKDNNPKYYVYNYFHPGLAVDIVVLKMNAYSIGKTDYVELKIPLIKRSKGVGAGWWGLPGGFLSKEDFLKAGWDGKPTDFDPRAFTKYTNNLKSIKKRAICEAAKEILRKKTGILLDDDAKLYPLTIRDNPMRGTADGVPVIAETLVTVLGGYNKKINLNHQENTNVADQRWFTIKFVFYNDDGDIIKDGTNALDTEKVSSLSSDKHSPLDLRFNPDETDAFIMGDNTLMVHYFKGKQVEYNNRKGIDKSQDPINLFADHRDAIIDALQFVKDKTLSSTILADFLMESKDELDEKNFFKIGYFEQLYHTLLFPEEKLRQSLQGKVVMKDSVGNNGFLEKPDGNPHALYRFNLEKFNEFIYRNISIF